MTVKGTRSDKGARRGGGRGGARDGLDAAWAEEIIVRVLAGWPAAVQPEPARDRKEAGAFDVRPFRKEER
jgi:hypothetical protein